MKLEYKIHITGTLTVETGMHIGGSEVELEIGGIDNAVIKDSATGVPYIPGSSLKGKLRDLIARHNNYKNIENDMDATFILFGVGATKKSRNFGHLIVRDSFYNGNTEFDFKKELEEKSENVIDRVKGDAKPRHMERVVRNVTFGIDMILDIYEKYNYLSPKGFKVNEPFKQNDLLNTLKTGFRLLENDYLGGSGTRGYGKVSLKFNKPNKIFFIDDGTVKIEPMTYDFNLPEK